MDDYGVDKLRADCPGWTFTGTAGSVLAERGIVKVGPAPWRVVGAQIRAMRDAAETAQVSQQRP